MLYLIAVIVLILIYILFSNFVSGYKIDKLFNPIIVQGSDTISNLKKMPYDGSKIIRSEDKKNGIEFTYTTWIKLDENLDNNYYYNLFLKGTTTNDSFKPTQSPGVWVKKDIDNSVNEMQLVINFDTFLVKDNDINCKNLVDDCESTNYCTTNDIFEEKCNRLSNEELCNQKAECKYDTGNNSCNSSCSNKSKESIILHNIPYKRWFHLAIIVKNKEVDIYINGNLYNTFQMKGVIKQNHNDLLFGYTDSINPNSLTSTIISDFRYFNYAIPYYRLDNLLNNTKNDLRVPVNKEIKFKPYLNRRYWTEENTRLDIYEQETN